MSTNKFILFINKINFVRTNVINKFAIILLPLLFISSEINSQDCGDVIFLCGETIESTTIGAPNNFGTNDYSNCHTSSSLFSAGDVVFEIRGDAGDKIELNNLSNFDLDLFLFSECPIGEEPTGLLNNSGTGLNVSCISASVRNGNQDEEIVLPYSGSFWVVVDGYDEFQEGNFSIRKNCLIDCSIFGYIDCENSVVEDWTGCGPYPPLPFPPICFNSEINYSCSNKDYYLGLERHYNFSAPKSGLYEFSLTGMDGDADIFIFQNICGTYYYDLPNRSCFGSSTNFSNENELIEVFLFQGQEIVIIVDGIEWTPYFLSISCPNGICDDITDVQCNTNYNTAFSESTNEATIYYCTEGGNANNFVRYEDTEYKYKFTPSTSGIYTFNALTAFGSSPAIIVTDCCDVTQTSEPTLQCGFVDCDFSINNSVTQNSATLIAGVEYYIFVENTDINGSDEFLFWVNCECNLFSPLVNQMGNDIIFENNSQGSYVSHTIKFPYDENYTYSDSLSQLNSNGTITCHFPQPGCYEVCFYYRIGNQIRKCCFKYCPIIKKYDCTYPIIKEVSITGNTSTINVECFFDEMPVKSSQQNLNICLLKVKPTDGTTVTEYPCGSNITLPHGEYEVCCWLFDPVCNSWQVCCKIICLPYIPPTNLACGKENIQVEKISQTEYKYTWLDNPDGLEWSIMPNVNFNTSGNMMTVRYPSSGVYKVCGIGLTNLGTVILRDTCCVYTCIDNEPDIPCEQSFDIKPLPNNKLRLICKTGRPVLRWEVTPIPNLAMTQIYYGPNPIIPVFPGATYEITKYFAGCCGVEESCTKVLCYDDPFECNDIFPKYTGRFDSNSSLEYMFSLPEGKIGIQWKIDELDLEIGTNTNSVSYTFGSPGCYTISVLIYDPINECYVICCKRICITYPRDCNLLKYWFAGDEANPSVYDISLINDCVLPMRQLTDTRWNINGIDYPEYNGLTTLNNLNLANFLIPGSQEILICVMFYDPCLKACRWCYIKIRLEPPFNCSEFEPVFVNENNYTFSANGNYETTYWTVGGIPGLCFNEGLSTFDLSNPAIQELIIDTNPDFIYVYFYYRVNFCWKVCCKKICLKGPDGCETFGEGCDYFETIYNEDFQNGPPLGFGYNEGDSININMEWWKGQGIVQNESGFITTDETQCLLLSNSKTENVAILKVAFDINVLWQRDLGTGQYGPIIEGGFCLATNTTCLQPEFGAVMMSNPNLLKYCGGGADFVSCTHKIELLINRNGPIDWFIDGRKVNEIIGSGNEGGNITKINFFGNLSFDNVCIAECKDCLPPVITIDPFVPCNDIVFTGFNTSVDESLVGSFVYNGNNSGQGWIINLVDGAEFSTVFENNNAGPLFYGGFLPGRTYIVCFKYLDENGCLQYCCYKVNIPFSCTTFTPYFAGDDDQDNLTFRFDIEGSNEFGTPVAWYVGNEMIGTDELSITYRFPSPGTYYVYCVYWDPITKCYTWCCRKICIDYPLNCDRIIIDYDGATNEYILSANGVQQVISWNIDIPTGLPNRGYIGNGNPQRFDPADFGILPGTEIVISVRYIDADGCIKICCRRICLPLATPLEDCNNIFPIYTGDGLKYKFEIDPSDQFEEVIWRLHIPGSDQTIQVGSGNMSNVLDFELLKSQYPSLVLDKVCLSIFYRDRVTGCYKVCCKCFCILQNPFECNAIKYHYSGNPNSKLKYSFDLDIAGAQDIKWTLDNTNTFLSNQASFDIDFASLNIGINDEIFISVRFYDPISECYRVCCKRLCLTDPYLGCNKINANGPIDNIITLSTDVNNPIWSIEGITGIYSESPNPVINLADPAIIAIAQGNSTINVCVVYMENGCCKVCCTPVCLIPSVVDCNNFNITSETNLTSFTFSITDSNSPGLSTEVSLPNGSIETLSADITSYINTLEGEYIFCRDYISACSDTIRCCKTICVSFDLNCEPFEFSIDENNDRIYTFTHNIIGGVSYSWDFGDGTIVNSDLTTIAHTYGSVNQQYTVCLTVTDECGEICVQCTTISLGEINVNPIVVNPTCANLNNGSIDLNISGGILPITILWSTNATAEQLINLGIGSYSVTITEGNGQDTVLNFVLTAPPLPILVANVMHTTCGNNNGSINILSTNNISLISFSWSPSGISTLNENAFDLTAGNYRVTVIDSNGCESVLNDIVVNPSTELNGFDFGIDQILCVEDTLTLDLGTINASNIVIEWYKDGSLIASNSRTLDVISSGTYHVLVSNNAGCTRSDTIIVSYYDDLIQLPTDETGLLYGETVTISVTGASSVTWNSIDAELSCTNCPSTSFEIFTTTTIFVSATDINNCTKSDTIIFELDDMPIEGPNFFTPNNDGANDFLEFKNLDRFSINSLTIFNRWGQILHKKDTYTNDWDGTIDGKEVPDGVYYYVLRYGNTSLNQFEYKSDLTIIRNQ